MIFGDGLDKTNYYGVTRRRWTAAGWSIGASAGTAPRNDLWLADLSDGRAGGADAARRAGGRGRQHRRCTSAATGGCTSSPTATRPRGRLAVTTPERPDVRALDRPRPRGRRGGARGLRDPRRPGPDGVDPRRRHAAVLLDPARDERGHRARPAHRRARRGTVPLPGLGSVTGLAERPEGGHEAWFGYTDHDDAGVGLPLRRAHRRDHAVGDRARAPSRCPRCTPGRSSTPPPTARRCGCSCCRRPRSRTSRGPTVLYGYGGFGIPMTPGLLRRAARLGRGRRRLRGRQPARRLRGGRGVAPRRDARATSRTSSTTSTPRPSGWSPTAGRRRPSWRSRAAPTAGCWSAPR